MIPEAITKDLKAGLSLDETLTKYGTNLRELFMQNQNKTPVKFVDEWMFIQPTKHNTFRISKVLNGHKIEFSTYKTHEDAICVRDKLMECDWDKNRLPEIWESTGVKPTRRGGYRRNKPHYYYHRKKDDMWVIQRIINGDKPYLGEYKTEKAAALAVSLFEKYGWAPENNWRVKYEVKQILGDEY